MSWTDGFSRCAAPGTDCIVWWDAWAVVVSIVGIGATVFLGIMTLKLGEAANAASKAALDISVADANLREKRDHDERLILLMRVTGEVSYAWQVLTTVLATVARDDADQISILHHQVRADLMRDLRGISFSTFSHIADRLHVIGNPVAAQLARAVGLLDLTIRAIDVTTEPTTGELPSDLGASLRAIIPMVLSDLVVVKSECEAAVRELGLDDPQAAAIGEAMRTGTVMPE